MPLRRLVGVPPRRTGSTGPASSVGPDCARTPRRLGVLWRKNAFGCHSAAGCRFVERMLTVVQTLRLQKRPVLDYLYRAIVAHRGGLPAPQQLRRAGN